MSDFREEEALGKVYDSRLARRLFGYLRPYRNWVIIAGLLTLPVAPLAALGPRLFEIAVDRYIVPALHNQLPLAEGVRGLGWMSLAIPGHARPGLRLPVFPGARHAEGRPGHHV